MLNLCRESQGHIHSFKLSRENIYIHGPFYLVMEYSNGFTMQTGKEWACKNIIIFFKKNGKIVL